MIPERTPSRAVAAVVTGVGTAAFYATPDVISSRTARGWTKAGLTALAVAASMPELRATWATAREPLEPGSESRLSEVFRSLPVRSKAVVVGSVAALLAGSIGGVVIVERWAFRHGQARAAAGKRLPHTGPALLYGALASGLWLLPTPSDTH
jgi:Ca2+/Na+ antiporter